MSVMPLRDAWEQALYGPDGFYTREAPAAHFRTAPTASPLYAAALAELAAACDLDTVVDLGAGGGELLAGLAAAWARGGTAGGRDWHGGPLRQTYWHGGPLRQNPIGADFPSRSEAPSEQPAPHLIGVDLRPRPDRLPAAIDWRHDLPNRISGLVIANEWLDNLPCPVAEVDEDGRLREVLVDPRTGTETLGDDVAGPDLEWARRWWPASEPCERVEIGRARDTAWRDVVSRLDHGLALAVDYGHVAGARPTYGSLRAYRGGRADDVAYDGSRDITADVALDSVAAAVDGRLLRQRDALHALGISARRPDLELARTDPAGYVRALSQAGAAAELTGSPGLGEFGWIVTTVGVSPPFG